MVAVQRARQNHVAVYCGTVGADVRGYSAQIVGNTKLGSV
jgi:hypothetical protein